MTVVLCLPVDRLHQQSHKGVLLKGWKGVAVNDSSEARLRFVVSDAHCAGNCGQDRNGKYLWMVVLCSGLIFLHTRENRNKQLRSFDTLTLPKGQQ